MTKQPVRLAKNEWSTHETLWRGNFEGKDLGGVDVTVLFVVDEIGGGAGLHVHPYDEIFIVREGRVLYTIGDEKVEATAGDVVLGPANVPHKFENLGPGPLQTTDIHVNDEWIQIDLEESE